MTKINNKLLALFEGRCWHEFDTYWIGNKCKHCGAEYYNLVRVNKKIIPNPSYATSPADQKRLLEYLMGQGEMWRAFKTDILTGRIGEAYDSDLIIYLFLPLPGTTTPRWLFLLQEWLELEETRERFGFDVDCPDHKPPCVLTCENDRSCRNGKVKAEWARLVQEKEEG